jgi:hypothetical protein
VAGRRRIDRAPLRLLDTFRRIDVRPDSVQALGWDALFAGRPRVPLGIPQRSRSRSVVRRRAQPGPASTVDKASTVNSPNGPRRGTIVHRRHPHQLAFRPRCNAWRTRRDPSWRCGSRPRTAPHPSSNARHPHVDALAPQCLWTQLARTRGLDESVGNTAAGSHQQNAEAAV